MMYSVVFKNFYLQCCLDKHFKKCDLQGPLEKNVLWWNTLWSSQLQDIKQIFRASQNHWYCINVHFEPLKEGYIMKHFFNVFACKSFTWRMFQECCAFPRASPPFPHGIPLNSCCGISFSFVLIPKLYSLKKIFILNWHLFIVLVGFPRETVLWGKEGVDAVCLENAGTIRGMEGKGGDFEKHRQRIRDMQLISQLPQWTTKAWSFLGSSGNLHMPQNYPSWRTRLLKYLDPHTNTFG